MSSSSIVKTGAVERVVAGPIVDVNGNLITGLTSIQCAVMRASDLEFLDWSTNGFTATPTTLRKALVEVDATRVPGVYALNIDTSTFVSPVAQDRYFVVVSQQGATTAANANQMGELRVGQIVDKIETNLLIPNAVTTGTAQAGTTNTITLATAASAVDQTYRFSYVWITGGTGAGQANAIVAYTGSTKVAIMGRNWTTVPDTTSVYAVVADVQPIVVTSGLLQSATTATATLMASASSTDALYVDAVIRISGGTGAGQVRQISGYVGATKVATVYEAWTVTPDSTSGYEILPFGRAKVMSTLAGAITSASFATGAITAASFAASAITATVFTQGAADLVWNTAVRTLSAGAIVGATFASGALAAVWDELHSNHSVAGSFGLLLDVAISSRLATTGYTVPPTAVVISAAVVDQALSGHTTGGSVGAALSNLDVAVSTRLASSSYTAAPTAAANAAAVWNAATSSFTTAGTYGALLGTNLDAQVSSRSTLAAGAAMALTSGALSSVQSLILSDATPFAGASLVHLDVAVSTRATPSDVTTAISTINAHTDSAVGPLATSAGVTAATAPLATSAALSTGLTAIEGVGFTAGDDLHGIRAAVAAIPTTSAPTASAISAQVGTDLGTAHGTGPWTTADVSAVATTAQLSSAVAAIASHTDTAVGPLATATELTAATSGLATSAALTTAQGDLTAIMGSGFTTGDDMHSIKAAVLAAATPPSAAAIASVVWATVLPGTFAPGTTGAALTTAAAYTIATPSTIAAAVWALDLSSYGTYSQVHLAGGVLYSMKIQSWNKAAEIAGNPGSVAFYQDDGATLYASSALRDVGGGAVTAATGEPAQRSAAA